MVWRVFYLQQCCPVSRTNGPIFGSNTEMRILGFDIKIRSNREIQLETELRNMQNLGPSGWGQTYDSLFLGSGIITRQKALSVPAVFAAVDTVARTLASLPFGPFYRTETGSEPATTHPLWYMETREPSEYTTAFNFRRDMFADVCFGNAFAKITFKGNGRAGKLERLVPEEVFVYQADNGNLYYIVNRKVGTKSVQEVLGQYEVLHLRGMSIDGWQGIDIANTFSSSFATSIDATRYGHNFFNNNAAVDGVIEYPGGLDPKQRQLMESKIKEKHAGVNNVGGIMLLDAGSKYNKIGTNPQEAMLNETRMFQAYESCRIFGVPAHMINVLDRSTFNNIEMMDNGFVKYCVVPLAEQFENENDIKLLTRSEKESGAVFHRFDVSGLMRGDMKSRGEYEDKMLKNMVYTINDVRRINNLNTVTWGDRPYAQAGVTPVNEDGTIDINTPAESGQNETDNEPQGEQ